MSGGRAKAPLEPPPLFGCPLAGVRLAWVDLDAAAREEEALAEALAPEERERAARFRFTRDRRRYVAARATLRAILGSELGMAAAAVPLAADAHGKPHLAGLAAGPSFNLSHTGPRALYAVAQGVELGVDAEELKPLADMAALARSVFSPDELREWQSLPEPERVAGFFAGWTRKEAFLKALGHGLDYPLDAFSVTLSPGCEPRLVHVRADAGSAADWRMHAFEPEHGYVAAIVMQGRGSAGRLGSSPGSP